MTFNEFIERIEQEREHCKKQFSCYESDKDYYEMGHYTAIIRSFDWVLSLAKDVNIEETKHNDFSWDNVNIGDEVVEIEDENCIGKVTRLIYDSDGYCQGIIAKFPGIDGTIPYQDDEYKMLFRIGAWYNK